jgi:hypothetical protein
MPTASALAEIEAAIRSPNFSHSRAGDGCWRDVRWIYHRDSASPSGVSLACAGDAAVVEPILRALRNTSPLSPTER